MIYFANLEHCRRNLGRLVLDCVLGLRSWLRYLKHDPGVCHPLACEAEHGRRWRQKRDARHLLRFHLQFMLVRGPVHHPRLVRQRSGLIPALAFLLASTNLVIELGIVIAVFLSWQFVVGEYLGGVLLIGLMWLLVRATFPKALVIKAREKARREEGSETDEDIPDWRLCSAAAKAGARSR